MDIEKALNKILQSLRQSSLHFSATETPYSLYLTIRKKKIHYQQNHQHLAPLVSRTEDFQEENVSLKNYCDSLEKTVANLRNDLESEVRDHEAAIKDRDDLASLVNKSDVEVKELYEEISALKQEVKSSKDNVNAAKKSVKEKDKIIHDLKKDNLKLSDNNEHLKYELKELSDKVKHCEREKKKLKGKENMIA